MAPDLRAARREAVSSAWGSARTVALSLVATILVITPSLVAGTRGAEVSFFLSLAVVFLGGRTGHLRAGLVSAGVVAAVNLALAGMHLQASGGDRTILLVQAALFSALTGAIAAVLGSQQRAEIQLRREARIAAEVSSGFQIGICMLDREGRIESANDTARRILRRGDDDLQGVLWDDLVRRPEWGGGSKRAAGGARRSPGLLATEEAEIATPTGTIRVAYVVSRVRSSDERARTVVSFIDVTQSHRTFGDLTVLEERYRRIFELAPDGVVGTDNEGRIVIANRRMARMWGVDQPEDLVGLTLADLVAENDPESLVLTPAGESSSEGIGMRTDGTAFSVEIHTEVVAGDPDVSYLHICRDSTSRAKDREALIWRDSSTAFQHAVSDALSRAISLREATREFLAAAGDYGQWDVGIAWVRLEGTGLLQAFNTWHSPSFDDIGFAAISREIAMGDSEDLPGRAWQERTPVWEPDIRSDVAFSRRLVALKAGLRSGFAIPVLTGNRVHMVLEFFSRRAQEPSDSFLEVMQSAARYLGQFYERASAQEALEHQALHDTLTDLPNRVLLQQRVDRAIDAATERKGQVALLLMDLDRFKDINDTLGHAYGDVLLKQVGDRLRACLDESVTIARLGGDEFSVLLPASDDQGAIRIADRLLEALQRPYMLADQQVVMGASVGIAIYPQHGDGVHDLLQHADVAMYQAKRAQSGRAIYLASDDDHSRERLTTMAELAAAIRDGRLNLVYQPKMDLRSGGVETVEALVRWYHPQRGLLRPDDFIPLAEQAGLTKDLLRCVLTMAIRQCAIWQRSGLELSVAVNLSPQLLYDPDLTMMVRGILTDNEFPAPRLTLEITESVLMANAERAFDTLVRLRDLGVRVSVDDFGSGYSSLSYLTRLPLDELKIDRSFIRDLNDQQDNVFVARSIVELGHNLGLEVTAEGVESAEVLEVLEEIGCDLVQGYYFSEPLSPTDLVAWFDARYGTSIAEASVPRGGGVLTGFAQRVARKPLRGA